MKKKIAVYPGTFDPPTNGHIEIVNRALKIFDEIIIGVAQNINKTTLFTIEERVNMLKEIFQDNSKIIVKNVPGLLVNFVNENNAIAIVRGLRAVSDFEYELQMATMNSLLNPEIETIFFMSSQENIFINSSVVKEIVKFGGDISSKIPEVVMKRLKNKFNMID